MYLVCRKKFLVRHQPHRKVVSDRGFEFAELALELAACEFGLAAEFTGVEPQENQLEAPRWTGGKNWFPMSFTPSTGRLYLSMLEETAIYQLNTELRVY